MANLMVWKFNTAKGAEIALDKLVDLQKQELIEVMDAAIVAWESGKRKPVTKQVFKLMGLSALDGEFLGMLFGLPFFIPMYGVATGTLCGGLARYLSDYGFNRAFIKDIREKIKEGTSALFILTGELAFDKVNDAFQGESIELIQSHTPG